MDELKEIYETYIAQAEECRKSRNPLQALFGLRSAESNPVHTAFYNAVGDWTDHFVAGNPSAQSADEALRWILFSAAEHEKSAAVWYFIAAQGHGKKLIPLIGPEAAKALYEEYKITYPRGRRLPLQDEVLALLKKAVG